jgi:uncharacterized membrane protein (UPF0127 family)
MSEQPDPNDLAVFDRTEIRLGGQDWTVAVADTPVLRGQGLMRVTELVDVDGMIFVWDEEISASFFMLHVSIPLEIAFFDSNGALVDHFTMAPCPDDDDAPCPTYPAAGPFQYAIETTVGGFDGMELVLEVAGL